MDSKWNEIPFKDRISYILACVLVLSGILMAFASVIFNNWVINDSVLIYIAQAFVCGGSLLGVTVYIHSKISAFKEVTAKTIDEAIAKLKEKKEEE